MSVRERLIKGLTVSSGSIADAMIINASNCTKHASAEHDREIHQTKKGNQWYFGMKEHVGFDHDTKMIDSVTATSADVHDSHLIRGNAKNANRLLVTCALANLFMARRHLFRAQ